MKRREFMRGAGCVTLAALTGCATSGRRSAKNIVKDPAKDLPLMTHNELFTAIEKIPVALSADSKTIVAALHGVAIKHGCDWRLKPGAEKNHLAIVYSGRSLVIKVDDDKVSFSGVYDIRGIMDFYRDSADATAKKLLFETVRVCEHCDDVFCCGLIERVIEDGGKKKILCGPWRHEFTIDLVRPNELASATAIAEMMFAYFIPSMHKRLAEDEVTYAVKAQPARTVVGFAHYVSMLSVKTEDFIAGCLTAGADGKRKIDELLALTGQADNGQTIGVTADFLSGSSYTFILGLACEKDKIPAELPKGVVKIELGAGDYVVYNNPGAGAKYGDAWKHFNNKFFDAEKKGYDAGRLPFEFYDKMGQFRDISIPVSAERPKDSGRYVRTVFTPDIVVAGIPSCTENDHPLFRENSGLPEKLLEAFPVAERIFTSCTHATLGKSMICTVGVEVDRLDVVPPEFERLTFRGGYWNIVCHRHFTGHNLEDYAIENLPFVPRTKLDTLNHPRTFICYNYTDRGGYSETATPVRKKGERKLEVVERPPRKLVGKEETLASGVNAADFKAFENMANAVTPGSYTMAMNRWTGMNRHEDRPIIKGAEVTDYPPTLVAGLKAYTLDGGKYVKITETLPNGELDWCTPGYVCVSKDGKSELEKETGHVVDSTRLIIVHQLDHDREFAMYVPIM